jgi:hypothetical protein
MEYDTFILRLGPAGTVGLPGEAGEGSFIFARYVSMRHDETCEENCFQPLMFRHSQDTNTPQCPFKTTKMVDGYSFMGIQGDAYAAHQDLGKSMAKIEQWLNVLRFRWFGQLSTTLQCNAILVL